MGGDPQEGGAVYPEIDGGKERLAKSRWGRVNRGGVSGWVGLYGRKNQHEQDMEVRNPEWGMTRGLGWLDGST